MLMTWQVGTWNYFLRTLQALLMNCLCHLLVEPSMQSVCSRAPFVIKFGYLCIQEIFLLHQNRLTIHTSAVWACLMLHCSLNFYLFLVILPAPLICFGTHVFLLGIY